MSTLVITGGAGFIGSNLVRHLLTAGHRVVNVDKLTYAGNVQSLADVARHPNYKFHRLDITDGGSISQLLQQTRPSAILHLAAESHVDRSIDQPRVFIDTNIVGTFTLLQCALQYWQGLPSGEAQAFRFLHVSTDEVYGSLGPTGCFHESTPYDPHSPYSASKAASDHLARAWYHTYGLPVLVTNCSNNYGPYQYPEKLIPVVILNSLRGEPIPVYGQGQNVRDWLYVGDHCRALAAVVARGRPGETYNIGGNNELRNIDLVRQICQIMDQLRPRRTGGSYCDQISYVTDRLGHDRRYAIDFAKIKTELGWVPTTDPQAALADTVAWYLHHPTWWQSILASRPPAVR